MAKRLVLAARPDFDNEIGLDNIKEFVRRAEESGLPAKSRVKVRVVTVTEGDEDKSVETSEYRLELDLPENSPRVVGGKKLTRKRPTKKEREVEAQIEQHKKDKEEGKKVAHVPAVKGTKKKTTKKRTVKKHDAPTPEAKVEKPEESASTETVAADNEEK